MADQIKAWLYRVLGQRRYLYLVSQLFFLAYRSGWLRSQPEYACHYYVDRLIEEGDYVLDVGGNLGYYTVLFAEWTGPEGKVYSVEPVPLYREILRRNVASFSQVEIVPYALGDEPGTVQMGLPESADPYRHGHTRILSDEGQRGPSDTVEVEVRSPERLFGDLPRLDYVKCDVEGHEGAVLPAMASLLREHRPVVQVEVAPDNRRPIYRMMASMGYRAFYVRDDERIRIDSPDAETQGDWFFLPS
jgi:FkbM family methyltransferase